MKLYVSVWFLKSAFVCYLVSYFLMHFSWKPCLRWSLFVGCLLISQTVPLPYMLNYMFPCFLVGIGLSMGQEGWMKYRRSIVIASLLIYCASLPFWNMSMNAFHPVIGESGLCGQSVVQNLIRLVIGVSGSLALITSFSYDDSTHPWMSKIGQNTLGLYVLNITFSDMQRHILPLDWTNEWPALGLALLLTMIEIPLFLGIIRLIKKHKYATLFFLGRE